MTYSHY